MSVTLSGCGFFPLPEPLSYEPEEEVKLSVNEVLQKSLNAMNSLYGYQILTRVQGNRSIQDQYRTVSEPFSYELDQRFNLQPPAFHSIRKEFKQDGSVTTNETYLVNGVAYTNVGTRWVRLTQPRTKISLSQNPIDLISFAIQANNQGITMEKETGAYRLILNESAGKGFLQLFFDEMRQSYLTQGVVLSNQNIRVNQFQQVIWIDDRTFKFQKMSTDLEYMLDYNGRTLRATSHVQVDYRGDYNQPIVVPGYVQNSVAY